MKKIIGIITFISFFLWGCDNMNSINQEWIDRGEMIYTGAVDSLKIHAGNNRLYLVWQMNADPRIAELVIHWNNKKDSLILPVTRDTEEKIGIYKDSILINEKLEEGVTVFQLYTRDNKGHRSIPKEITADVYGPNFAESTSFRYPRRITAKKTFEGENKVELTFEKLESTDVQRTELTYTSYENSPQGEEKTIIVNNATNTLMLENIALGDEFKLQSIYIPTPDAIDYFPGKKATFRLPRYYLLTKERWEDAYHSSYNDISKKGWTTWASTEELTGEGAVNGRASAIIDDDPSTFWHSAWKTTTPQFPHIVEIDMKTPQTFYSFELRRRNDNKDLKTVVMEISLDYENWEELGNMVFSEDKKENSIVFLFPNEPVVAQYLRIKAKDSNNGNRSTSISEINLATKP